MSPLSCVTYEPKGIDTSRQKFSVLNVRSERSSDSHKIWRASKAHC